jgi:hypothetical protein
MKNSFMIAILAVVALFGCQKPEPLGVCQLCTQIKQDCYEGKITTDEAMLLMEQMDETYRRGQEVQGSE